MNLPTFKYHPNPIETGAIEESETTCVCCGKARGFVYVGPVYAEEEYDGLICPWCIADGSAHEKLDAEFFDIDSIPGYGFSQSEEVSEEIAEEIAYRTPGFCAWQQEQWATCCGDAAVFLGKAGRKELETRWPEAVEPVRESTGLDPDERWDHFFGALRRDGSPTAYIFQCSHCGKFLAYTDCD